MDPDVDPRIPEPVSASALPEFEDAPLDGRERIDRGGDADVYRSTVDYQGESYRVAVKQPRLQGTLGRHRLENFEAEVEVWNTLGDHDNIVSVYGWGTRPEPWLALEYMDAGTLKSKLGTVDLAEALWLAGRIAEGVHYGHRNGIAHLDLKPSNILCRETGAGTWTYPKIADWGLAKLLLEGSSVNDGYSSQYAAPEQRAPDRFGEPNDITDIYQLGAVVYSLLTGEPPETRSITDTGTEIFRTPNPPSHQNPAIPSVVDEAVLTALEPVPSDRYDSVVTLRNELERGLTEVFDDADDNNGSDQQQIAQGIKGPGLFGDPADTTRTNQEIGSNTNTPLESHEIDTSTEETKEIPVIDASKRDERQPLSVAYDDALRKTNLHVRYKDRDEGMLQDAANGYVEEVTLRDNLRLDHHTEFDEAVTVEGQPFESFLRETTEYQFSKWLLIDLPFNIRQDGHQGLLKLYDSLQHVDRIDFGGDVDLNQSSSNPSFDLVFRDESGDPRLIATIDDTDGPSPEKKVREFIDDAESVARSRLTESLVGAFFVTSTFFDAGAMHAGVNATQISLLSLNSRSSYKSGFHLCLVEEQDEDFCLTIPEL